jgi:hypothetical protein
VQLVSEKPPLVVSTTHVSVPLGSFEFQARYVDGFPSNQYVGLYLVAVVFNKPIQ